MAARKTSAQVEEAVAPGPHLFDLDAEEAIVEANRQRFVSGGKIFEVRSPEEFSMAPKETLRMLLLQQRQIVSTPVRLDDDASDGSAMTYTQRETLLDDIEARIIRMAVIDPPEEIVLSGFKRTRVINIFTDGLGDTLLPLVMQIYNERMQGLLALEQARKQALEQASESATPNSSPPTGDSGTPTDEPTDATPPDSFTATAAD